MQSFVTLFLLHLIPVVIASQPHKQLSAPTHFFVFGDRYSGVQYLTDLLRNNFSIRECSPTPPNPERRESDDDNNRMDLSWRYGFFGKKEIQTLDCSPSNTLFVLIVKDPYAWLTSVAERKFQTSKLEEMHMNSLVRHIWEDDTLYLNGKQSRTKFKSLVSQRTSKLQKHYAFLSGKQHSAVVRYEDLLENLEATLQKLLRGRGLSIQKKQIVDVPVTKEGRKGGEEMVSFTKRRYYLDKEYLNLFNSKTLNAVSKELDSKLESEFRYAIKPKGISSSTTSHNERAIRNGGGILYTILRFVTGLLWWIVVVTLVMLVVFTPMILWMHGKKYGDDDDDDESLSKEDTRKRRRNGDVRKMRCTMEEIAEDFDNVKHELIGENFVDAKDKIDGEQDVRRRRYRREE